MRTFIRSHPPPRPRNAPCRSASVIALRKWTGAGIGALGWSGGVRGGDFPWLRLFGLRIDSDLNRHDRK